MSRTGAGPLFTRSSLLAANRSQIKTRDRVRDLAEVYTHEREIHAMLDLVPDMFPTEDETGNHDPTFLEPNAFEDSSLEYANAPDEQSAAKPIGLCDKTVPAGATLDEVRGDGEVSA